MEIPHWETVNNGMPQVFSVPRDEPQSPLPLLELSSLMTLLLREFLVSWSLALLARGITCAAARAVVESRWCSLFEMSSLVTCDFARTAIVVVLPTRLVIVDEFVLLRSR